jgi:alkylation response protein AidB-like acyl-CoA dehydrogenase
VASGEICFCLGYTEPDTGSDLAAVRTKAERDGNEWVINGQKMFTTGAQNCRYAFLVTRTNPEAPKHRGITMFLCPLDRAVIQEVHTLGGERTNMVFFDDVRIDDRYRLGDVDQGWGVLLGPLSTEHGMGNGSGPAIEARGGMYGRATIDALRVAIEWAEKPDPDGNRPIDDRTVRRRLAKVALDLEAMSLAPGPIGRIVSSEYLIRSARDLIDLVGPVGLLPNGAPGAIGGGWLEYSHRFAQGTATYGGTTDVHRNIIAERMLGLPRSTPR